MLKVYRRLWEGLTITTNEAEAVRDLAEIVADKGGKDFILRLERDEAKLCIGILDRVSRELRLPPPAVSDRLFRALNNITSNPLRRTTSSSC